MLFFATLNRLSAIHRNWSSLHKTSGYIDGVLFSKGGDGAFASGALDADAVAALRYLDCVQIVTVGASLTVQTVDGNVKALGPFVVTETEVPSLPAPASYEPFAATETEAQPAAAASPESFPPAAPSAIAPVADPRVMRFADGRIQQTRRPNQK